MNIIFRYHQSYHECLFLKSHLWTFPELNFYYWTALMAAGGSLQPIWEPIPPTQTFTYMIAFSISVSRPTNIYSECTDTHMHTQTMRAVAGRHSALHPVVSPHASKLFSVTQILIWKSQLTELTESREKGSTDPLSFSFSLSAPFDWYLLMPAAAHPYFMSISHRIQSALGMIAGHWSLFHTRIKTSPVIWALDYEACLWPQSQQQSLILLQHVSAAVLIVSVWLWLQNELFLFTPHD